MFSFFFFNDTATTEIYTLSLHDALPISASASPFLWPSLPALTQAVPTACGGCPDQEHPSPCPFLAVKWRDRKSTRLNSSHANISYAVFCLKKKKQKTILKSTSIKHTNTV